MSQDHKSQNWEKTRIYVSVRCRLNSVWITLKFMVHVRDYWGKHRQKFQVFLIETLCTRGPRLCVSFKAPAEVTRIVVRRKHTWPYSETARKPRLILYRVEWGPQDKLHTASWVLNSPASTALDWLIDWPQYCSEHPASSGVFRHPLTTCTHRVCYMTKNNPNNEPNLECIVGVVGVMVSTDGLQTCVMVTWYDL